MNNTFTVYAMRDPRSMEIRYVGITKHKLINRIKCHFKEAASGVSGYKCNWIRSLLSNGIPPVVSVLETGAGDGSETEKKWIRLGRESGSRLTNITDGGDGLSGYRMTLDDIKKISSSVAKSYIDNPELLNVRSRDGKEIWSDPKYKERMTAVIKERANTPEAKAAMADRSRENWANPEYKERTSAAIKEALSNPEVRAKKSEIAKEFCSRPEVIENRRIGRERALADPNVIANKKAAAKKSWENGEIKARRSAAFKAAWVKRKEKMASGELVVNRAEDGTYIKKEDASAASV